MNNFFGKLSNLVGLKNISISFESAGLSEDNIYVLANSLKKLPLLSDIYLNFNSNSIENFGSISIMESI